MLGGLERPPPMPIGRLSALAHSYEKILPTGESQAMNAACGGGYLSS